MDDEGVSDATTVLRGAIEAGLRGAGRIVLAVSGGLDSMTMLEAAARWAAPGAIVGVATFDHGTGPAATAAARLVAERAAGLGFEAIVGRSEEEEAEAAATGEAGWRRQRWRFLRAAADARGAAVATAHTRDDQAETVVMRILRGAGARGLAGLAAPSPIRRPLLEVSRSTIARFAEQRGVRWVEDPSNLSRSHLRNRVRLDLLPAILAVRPGFRADVVALGERAAAWRREVDALAASVAEPGEREGELRVPVARVAGIAPDALAVLWPALAALSGVTLDRRGTRRLAEFTISGRTNGSIQLSGGAEVVRRRGEFVIRPRRGHTTGGRSEEPVVERPLAGREQRIGRWRLVPLDGEAGSGAADDLWTARLPAGGRLTVRAWRPGDRVRDPGGAAARRVKRFFKDGGIAGVDRAGWPVVLLDGDIVWIPGLRRTLAATVPSGRPGVCYACLEVRERDNS